VADFGFGDAHGNLGDGLEHLFGGEGGAGGFTDAVQGFNFGFAVGKARLQTTNIVLRFL
jgi:hypothetical protein